MSQWDKDYIALCKRILSEGVEVEIRVAHSFDHLCF